MKLMFTLFFLSSLFVCSQSLHFDKTLMEYHAKPGEKVITLDYHFENKSSQDAVITKYNAPCQCLSALIKHSNPDNSSSLTFKPGEKGTIRAILEFGNFKGSIDKGIEIFLKNAPKDKPSIKLIARVHIPILIGPDKEHATWTVGDKLNTQQITITTLPKHTINITRIEYGFGASETFSSKLTTVKKGKKYILDITPKSTEKPVLGMLKCYTDSPLEQFKVVQIYLAVKPKKKEK